MRNQTPLRTASWPTLYPLWSVFSRCEMAGVFCRGFGKAALPVSTNLRNYTPVGIAKPGLHEVKVLRELRPEGPDDIENSLFDLQD